MTKPSTMAPDCKMMISGTVIFIVEQQYGIETTDYLQTLNGLFFTGWMMKATTR